MSALKFLFAALVSSVVGIANAQPAPPPAGHVAGPFSQWAPAGTYDIRNPSTWTPGATVPTSTGVARTATAVADVAGVKVPMAAKWTATKAAVATAGAAAGALCSTTLIGTIACAAAAEYAVYKGIEKCIEYGWCKPDQSAPQTDGFEYYVQSFESNFFPSRQAACNYYASRRDVTVPSGAPHSATVSADLNSCEVRNKTGGTVAFPLLAKRVATGCPAGSYIGSDGSCLSSPPLVESPPPYADPDYIPWLKDQQGNSPRFGPNFGPDLAQDATDKGYPPALEPAGPDVTGSPQTSPQPKTTTETRPRPDGSTDTVTRTTTTTVTPNVTNNQTTNVNITYNVTNQTTTTTTNSATGQTTVETSTENLPDVTPRLDFPNDYNREVTQQQIAKELAGDGAPPLPPDQVGLVDAAKTKAQSDLDALRTASETLDKSPWFSWVWTPPSGSCSPFSGDVHGYAISWDLCPTINNIRDVLGWLFAIFAAIEIYGQLFKREA